MRISTLSLQQQGLASILNQQARLAETQLQVATGRRIQSPSDDPVGSSQAQGLEQSLAQLSQFETNVSLAVSRLSLEESTLAGIGDVLQRVRELTIQASNDTQTAETRRLISVEIGELRDQLLSLANTQNGQGEYIFAGFRTQSTPFVQSATGVTYRGDQGQRALQVGFDKQVFDGNPGTEVFQFIPTGNGTFSAVASSANSGNGIISVGGVTNPAAFVPDTYTIRFISPTDYEVVDSGAAVVSTGTYVEGTSVEFLGAQVNVTGAPATGDSFVVNASVNRPIFTSLDGLIRDLSQYPDTEQGRAVLHTDLNDSLNSIDQAIGRVLDVRTSVGGRLTAVENQETLNEELEIQFRSTLSDIQDLDYAEAISRLNLELTGLEAAQQAFVRVQSLSLFNFL